MVKKYFKKSNKKSNKKSRRYSKKSRRYMKKKVISLKKSSRFNKDGVGGKTPSVGRSSRIAANRLLSASLKRNDSAIAHASRNNDFDEVRRLYNDNVNIDSVDSVNNSWTALNWAIYNNNFNLVKFLVYKGADVNFQNQDARLTPLIYSAGNNIKDILKFLIDNGADIDARSRRGNTALMNAVKSDNRGCVAILLMEGANDAILNKNGKTAFRMAVERKRPYAVKDAWEGMKNIMGGSKLDRILKSAAISSSIEHEPTTLLSTFVKEVPDSMKMMKDIISFHDGPIDIRFLDRDSKDYVSFANGVIKAFNTIPEQSDRKNKNIDFFMSFVNEGQSKPWSREKAIMMMEILEKDKGYEYGKDLNDIVNPLRLNLGTLKCKKDLVSL